MTVFLVLAAGLALLAWASEHFVIGASRLAFLLRLSPVLIGAVVIGFGTSAPEMITSVIAVAAGNRDVAIGNVVGSNAANVTLVLGVAVLLRPAGITSDTLRREAPLSTGAVVLFALLLLGGMGRPEGVLCLVSLGGVLFLLARKARPSEQPIAREVAEMLGEVQDGPTVHRVGVEAVRTLAGLVGTLVGAQALVWGAIRTASTLGLSDGFVGFTLVAIGTSLPELVTAIQAARRNESDLVIGNVLGSNVFNSLAVAGSVAVISPGRVADPNLAGLGLVLMVGVCVLTYLFMATGRVVSRWEGIVLLAVYAAVTPLLAL